MFFTDKEKLNDFTSDKRLWQLVPGIACTPRGRLFCTFYSGEASETLGNYCVLLQSDDGGAHFSEPIAVAYSGQMKRCFDPVVWIDPLGRLWFTWANGHRYGLYGVICEQPDADELVWSSEFYIGDGVMMNKPVVLSTGEWLFPIAIWDYWYTRDTFRQIKPYADFYLDEYCKAFEPHSGANVYSTTDYGKTFRKIGGVTRIDSRSHDEHIIFEKKDSTLVMLTRTKYGISRSFSYDKGKSWSTAENSGIAGPNSRFHIQRLKSGRLLMVNHQNFRGRNNLTAFLSEDDGETWPYRLLLDEREQVSYPDAAEGRDGTIYIVYDRERGGYQKTLEDTLSCAREILLAKINEADIINGSLSASSFLKKVVSRLGVYRGKPQTFAGNPPKTDPAAFTEAALQFTDKDRIFDAFFTFFPIDFAGMCGENIRKTDALFDCVRRDIFSESNLRKSVYDLAVYLNTLPFRFDRTGGERCVQALREIIRKNPAQDIDLPVIAESLQISRYYLYHLFEKKTGMTLWEYRNTCRYEEAKRQLGSTDLSVSEICQSCGIADVDDFVRQFCETEQQTPDGYRESLKIHTAVKENL